MFRSCSEFNSSQNIPGSITVLRTISIGIALLLGPSQIQKAQDEFPKQARLYAQQQIDLIPDPQIVKSAGGDFLINSATVVYADPDLMDLFPVANLQAGLEEALQIQVRKADSKQTANRIALKLVSEA